MSVRAVCAPPVPQIMRSSPGAASYCPLDGWVLAPPPLPPSGTCSPAPMPKTPRQHSVPHFHLCSMGPLHVAAASGDAELLERLLVALQRAGRERQPKAARRSFAKTVRLPGRASKALFENSQQKQEKNHMNMLLLQLRQQAKRTASNQEEPAAACMHPPKALSPLPHPHLSCLLHRFFSWADQPEERARPDAAHACLYSRRPSLCAPAAGGGSGRYTVRQPAGAECASLRGYGAAAQLKH